MALSGPRTTPETRTPGSIDPFAMPSVTTGRFLLLITAVVGASLFAYHFLYLAFGERQHTIVPSGRDADWWMVGGVMALLLVTGAFYLAMPRWIIRRHRLSPLSPEDSPELDEEVSRLASQAGLARPPVLLVDAVNPSVSALVFGLPGRRYLRLNGGLVTQFFTDITAFRATVRHELAHLRNRDVDQTYLTITIWYAFLFTALVPLVVALLGQPAWVLIGISWRVLVLIVIVRLFRNAVLRSREYGADARASQWDGPDGALPRVLAASAKSAATRQRWPFGTHPSIELRQAAIDDPKALFRLGFWDAAGAGLASTIAFGNVTTLINTLIAQPQPVTTRWVAALFFAPLAAAGVTVGIWRSVLYARSTGLQPPSTLSVGIGLGCGIIVGAPLSLPAAINGVWGPGPAPDSLSAAAALIVLVTAAVLLAAWIRSCALAWLPVVASRPRRVVAILAVAVSAAVLTALLSYWTLLRDLHPLMSILTNQARSDYAAVSVDMWPGPAWLWIAINHPLVLQLIKQDPVLVTVVVLLWVFPVAGLLRWHSSNTAGSGPVAPERTTRPGAVVLIGLASGAAYALFMLLHHTVIHNSIATNDRMVLTHWQITGAVTAQAAVALGVAVWAKSFRVVWGLLAAFVTGAVAVAAVLGFSEAGGCIDAFSRQPGPCTWILTGDFVARWVLVEGSLTAIAAGLLGAALAHATRRTSPVGSAPEHPEQPKLPGPRRSAQQLPLDSSGQVVADRKDP